MSVNVDFKFKRSATVTFGEGTATLKELRDALDDLLNPEPGAYGIAHDARVHIETWTPEMIVLVFEDGEWP